MPISGSIIQQFIQVIPRFPIESGNFAVYIFFAISGYVIANAAIGKPWPLSLLSRYVRLTAPMLAAALLAWALLQAFPLQLPEISQFLPNHWTTTIYQDAPPTLWQATAEAVWGSYLHGSPLANPVLWSMRIELWGSLALLTLYRFARPGQRLISTSILALLLLGVGLWHYLAFPIGAIFYEGNRRAWFRWPRLSGAMLAGLGVLVGIFCQIAALRYYSRRLDDILPGQHDLKALISSFGGLMVVAGVLASETGQSVLIGRAPQLLGRYSYALYLTHMPLLYGPIAALYLLLGSPPSWIEIAGMGVLFFPTALGVAWSLTHWIDEPVTRLVRVKRRSA